MPMTTDLEELAQRVANLEQCMRAVANGLVALDPRPAAEAYAAQMSRLEQRLDQLIAMARAINATDDDHLAPLQ
jgi:hypothetical protein